jgi:hypothetical protein
MIRRKAPDTPGHDRRSAAIMTSWVFVILKVTCLHTKEITISFVLDRNANEDSSL